MRTRFLIVLVLGSSISLTALAQDQSTSPPPTQPTAPQSGISATSQAATSPDDEIAHMHWQKSGDYTLQSSKSKLTIPPGFAGVFGPEAQRLMQLTNGTPNPETEAVLVNAADDMVVFDWQPEGYVASDDWSNVDADAMLKSIGENTATANAERRQQNIPELTITGWLKEPSFDRDSNTAFWTLEVQEGGKPLVNSVALRLARQGYEKVIWVADKSHFAGGTILQTMLTAVTFPIGSRYVDHVSGDKTAGYGIAALVATVAGAKVIKTVGFLGLLVFLKKLWLIPVVAAAGLWRKLKKRFAGRDA